MILTLYHDSDWIFTGKRDGFRARGGTGAPGLASIWIAKGITINGGRKRQIDELPHLQSGGQS